MFALLFQYRTPVITKHTLLPRVCLASPRFAQLQHVVNLGVSRDWVSPWPVVLGHHLREVEAVLVNLVATHAVYRLEAPLVEPKFAIIWIRFKRQLFSKLG